LAQVRPAIPMPTIAIFGSAGFIAALNQFYLSLNCKGRFGFGFLKPSVVMVVVSLCLFPLLAYQFPFKA